MLKIINNGGLHMEPMRFCMVSDKELTLQILNLNKVPSVTLVDPKTCQYPIIGRMYGQHKGKDISIINTPEQAKDEGYDYFTKLYAIEKEYCFEIKALEVKGVQIAEGDQVIYNELPIRTEVFGWSWKHIETSSVPTDWLNIAIRALYVTGATHGFVKIGTLPNETIIVTDINSPKMFSVEPVTKPALPFTIGADVEFMLSCDGDLLPASTFFPNDGPVGCDERQIERDSGEYALAEIRPEKAETPKELVNNIKKLIEEASEQAPYDNVKFHAGSMPFTGYQCGGHIHLGIRPSLALLRALDQYVALPFAMIEEPRTAKLRRKTKHGGLGRYRVKPYGIEYLSLSSWIIEPKLAMAILCLTHLVATHYHELKSDFLFHPLVQRAYYHGNQLFLKQLWEKIKPRIMATSSYSLYEKELSFLFEAIEKGYSFDESSDIRKNWGLEQPKQSYDVGSMIQIPKKMRLKYNLKEGQSTKVIAGKAISSAIIRPYPFTFRHSNMVKLSKSLRQKLNLPDNWIPKLTAVNGVLSLGPILGILARRPFERQTTYFRHLFRIAKEKQMLVYVFEPQDINWEEMMIKGTTMDGKGIFPFPAVIYDRYFHERKEKAVMDEIRYKLLSVYNIPFINPPNLTTLTSNKWKSHKLLAKEHEEYLPETRFLKHPSTITEMLDEHGEIFLKPLGGKLGIGVIRVIRRPSGIHVLNLNQKSHQKLASIDELFSLITPLMQQSPYLIQEGIRRKKFHDKNVEIRVYMQKSGKRTWLRTGMVSRLTSDHVLTEESESNVRLSKVLHHLYPNPTDRKNVYNQLTKISKDVVLTLEEEVGPFGELAVDLCIDQYGSMKLLEINAKPDNLFSQIKAYKLRKSAGIRLLDYGASLAGYVDEESFN
jgi:hypothetical protein